ncbi:argininosuccinate lyase [Christensenellaceae bacterium NSJ-44]|uniref:Argininosuccinate lyase n=1 Tax=Luoshenia tenuis TaxID=2763654 RepID=A0A926D380_9FIRM|nr:argininosuccinate lyase [Luoshenia tenuis]MBC8530099.1 argininosuccinate lyase [Luoshenia tenuis]
MKLWGGRFQKQTDAMVDDFHSSISFDWRLYRQDIAGSIAHATMLGEQGIIPQEDAQAICQGLKGILSDIEAGKVDFEIDAEDIHMNIEKLLTERIGQAGKRLHTGRSRNDQVALDMRMYCKDSIRQAVFELKKLCQCILDTAAQHLETIMPGYTHLQKAQPITLGHHLMAYFEMFKRDITRLQDCYDRVDVMPLGAGALAGTTYDLNRERVAQLLGFSAITANSLDAVSDRDFCIEFASCVSIGMMHLSRFCEELVLWSSNEFQFVEMDDGFSTGSSIMPQKKNPDVAELIRGKSGRVFGDLMALLTAMKGIPLAYNKDMQEDKENFFDARDTYIKCLQVFCGMFSTLRFNTDRMHAGAGGGFTNATDAADYLVKKGLPFREAHEVIGKIVFYCIEKGRAISELTLEEFRSFSPLFGEDVFEAVSLLTCVRERKVSGGPAPQSVKAHIDAARAWLDSLSE